MEVAESIEVGDFHLPTFSARIQEFFGTVSAEHYLESIRNNSAKLVRAPPGDNAPEAVAFVLTELAISLSLTFVRDNWTGPVMGGQKMQVPFLKDQTADSMKAATPEPPLPHVVVRPLFAHAAQAILTEVVDAGVETALGARLWLARCRSLVERAAALNDRDHIDRFRGVLARRVGERSSLDEYDALLADATDPLLFIEGFHSAAALCDVERADSWLARAAELAPFVVELSGIRAILSRDTSHEITMQILMSAPRDGRSAHGPRWRAPAEPDPWCPEMFVDDRTVREVPELRGPNPLRVSSPACLALALAKAVRAALELGEEVDSLDMSRISAFFDGVIRCEAAPPVLRISALQLRACIQCGDSSRKEISALQTKRCREAAARPASIFGAWDRLAFFFASPLVGLPWQQRARFQAEMFFALGSYELAGESFIDIEQYARGAECLVLKGRPELAQKTCEQSAAAIRAQLKRLPADAPAARALRDELAVVVCVLGEITGKAAHLERAWELSGHTLARAQRDLANLHMSRKDAPKAAKHLRLALDADPGHAEAWNMLGRLYIGRDPAEAVSMFEEATRLAPEDADGWSNLGMALMNSDQPAAAARAFAEAAFLRPNSLKIWSDFLIVAVETESLKAIAECLSEVVRILAAFFKSKADKKAAFNLPFWFGQYTPALEVCRGLFAFRAGESFGEKSGIERSLTEFLALVNAYGGEGKATYATLLQGLLAALRAPPARPE
eukprot:gnl/Chilomastix_cuspidata/1920.p1 GENE.gnl/Chilomastix_cuspidata/1920~~gnl/Chilomastix_cuspidata/1920.p1  ORF type:complete len:777 (+),score=318.14 gnl/Chilomastix_cuspidata/1920:132-2333(+)